MASSFAAGAGADALQDILRQKFTEAITKQRLAEEIRQANMQQQTQERHYGAQEDLARNQLDLQRQAGERADAAAQRAETAASAPVPVLRIVDGKLVSMGEAPHGARITEDNTPPPKPPVPVLRINPRTGRMESMGEAPAGAHFVQEPPPPSGNPDLARSDRSYQYSAGVLDKLRKPYDDAAMRLQRLHETLAQGTPQADALVAPELLTVMAGGQGSGLRMNEAEIARIVGGRSQWESLRASAQHWSTDPKTANSITPEQRQQIRALVGAVDERYSKALSALDQAGDALVNTNDPSQHRQILNTTKKALTGVNTSGSTAAGGPKAGDTKTFPNGRKAIWDGTGWVAQ